MTENTASSLPHVLTQFESLAIQNTEISTKATLKTDQEGQKKSVKKTKKKKLNKKLSWNKKVKRKK